MFKAESITASRKEFMDGLRGRTFDKCFYDLPMGNDKQSHQLLKSLASLDQTLRERLLVNHCSLSEFPEGVSRGPDGKSIESTISFEVPTPLYASASNLIEILEDTIFFKGLGVQLAGNLIQVSEAKTVQAGDVLVDVGEAIGSLSMIVSGSVNATYKVQGDGNSTKDSILTNNHWVTGDCFGEEALIGGVSSVKAVAASVVELVQISKLDLEWILSGTPVRERVQRCHDMRLANQPLERVLSSNTVLKFMTRSQKLALESGAVVESARAGDRLWMKGDQADFAVVIIEGKMMFPDAIAKLMSGLVKKSGTMMVKQEDARHNYCPDVFMSGAWIGNVMRLIDRCGTQKNALKAVSDCTFFKFTAKNVTRLLEANPGLFVSLGSSEFVI
jgi:CRP-like cAMP-binding protein